MVTLKCYDFTSVQLKYVESSKWWSVLCCTYWYYYIYASVSY